VTDNFNPDPLKQKDKIYQFNELIARSYFINVIDGDKTEQIPVISPVAMFKFIHRYEAEKSQYPLYEPLKNLLLENDGEEIGKQFELFNLHWEIINRIMNNNQVPQYLSKFYTFESTPKDIWLPFLNKFTDAEEQGQDEDEQDEEGQDEDEQDEQGQGQDEEGQDEDEQGQDEEGEDREDDIPDFQDDFYYYFLDKCNAGFDYMYFAKGNRKTNEKEKTEAFEYVIYVEIKYSSELAKKKLTDAELRSKLRNTYETHKTKFPDKKNDFSNDSF